MNDNLVRASDLTEAQNVIKSLSERLSDATRQLNDWKISMEGQVKHTNEGFTLQLKFSKGNGDGFIDNISQGDIEYYVEDPEALVHAVVENAIDNLLRQHLRNHISPAITRGLRNAKMMMDKS